MASSPQTVVGSSSTEPGALSAEDYERLGRITVGSALAGYVAGGAGEEWTLRENRAALRRLSLCPRVLCDVGPIQTKTSLLGEDLAMPLLTAPLAFLGMAHRGGEPAVARAASALKTVMCLSTFATVSAAELVAAAPDTRFWFQLYPLRDRGMTRALVEQARAAGAGALLLTADAPRIGRRERDARSGFSIPPTTPIPALQGLMCQDRELSAAKIFELVDPAPTWRYAEEIIALADLPVLVKGVLAPQDGRIACECGAAGVVVSNHGGRQLDGVGASVDALADVVEAVDGHVPVLLDGGIRRGSDVVKALALGAAAVLVGRPIFWALAARGEAGVRHLLTLLEEELELALALVGCGGPDDVTRDHLR